MTSGERPAAEPPQAPRDFRWAPLAVNGALLLALTVIAFNSTRGDDYGSLGYMMVMMFGVCAQTVGNGEIALVLGRMGRKNMVQPFVFSGIAVGIIGPGLCFGGVEIT